MFIVFSKKFNMSKEDYIFTLNEDIKGLSWSFPDNRWVAKYDKNKAKHFVYYESAKCFLLEHSKEAT